MVRSLWLGRACLLGRGSLHRPCRRRASIFVFVHPTQLRCVLDLINQGYAAPLPMHHILRATVQSALPLVNLRPSTASWTCLTCLACFLGIVGHLLSLAEVRNRRVLVTQQPRPWTLGDSGTLGRWQAKMPRRFGIGHPAALIGGARTNELVRLACRLLHQSCPQLARDAFPRRAIMRGSADHWSSARPAPSLARDEALRSSIHDRPARRPEGTGQRGGVHPLPQHSTCVHSVDPHLCCDKSPRQLLWMMTQLACGMQ